MLVHPILSPVDVVTTARLSHTIQHLNCEIILMVQYLLTMSLCDEGQCDIYGYLVGSCYVSRRSWRGYALMLCAMTSIWLVVLSSS